MTDSLTGARRTLLRMAWWIVAISGAWLVVCSPMDAYGVRFHCSPTHLRSANAGNVVTIVMGLLALSTSLRVLTRRTIATSLRLAGVMFLAMPIAFIEWIALHTEISHRCGTTVTEAWFVAPTRDAVLVIAFCGPVLYLLSHVLAWRERRSSDHVATARALYTP